MFLFILIFKKKLFIFNSIQSKKNLLEAGFFYFSRSKSAYFFPYTFIFLFLILGDFGQKIATLVSCL